MSPFKNVKLEDKLVRCIECKGTGSIGAGANVRICPTCKGVGVKKI